MKDTKGKKMDAVLERMFDGLKSSLVRELPEYFIKVSQVKKLFYVLVRNPRGKILGRKKEKLFDNVENTSKNIYFNYARECSD